MLLKNALCVKSKNLFFFFIRFLSAYLLKHKMLFTIYKEAFMKKLFIIIFCCSVLIFPAGCSPKENRDVQNGAALYENGEICGAPEAKY
jgi:hypothetical protein